MLCYTMYDKVVEVMIVIGRDEQRWLSDFRVALFGSEIEMTASSFARSSFNFLLHTDISRSNRYNGSDSRSQY